jgi:hypothetical protein
MAHQPSATFDSRTEGNTDEEKINEIVCVRFCPWVTFSAPAAEAG